MGIRYLDAPAPTAAPAKASKITYLDPPGPTPKPPGIMDTIFNIPGAAIRSGIQSAFRGENPINGYVKGAVDYKNVPKFQDLAIQAVNDNINKFDPKAGVVDRFSRSLGASAAGFSLDTLTNPAEGVMSLITGTNTGRNISGISALAKTKPAQKVIEMATKYDLRNLPRDFKNSIGDVRDLPKKAYIAYKGGKQKILSEAQDSLIQILQPQAKKLDIASKKGLESPESITNSIPYVKPSKTYKELAANLGDSKAKIIQQRNEILSQNNYKLGEDYLLPLRDEINLMRDPRRTPQTEAVINDADEMEKILNSYRQFNSQSGFNRLQAQSHKELLQRETEPLLKKISIGESTQRSPAEIKALDKVRFGLKKMVEGGDPEIKRLNDAWAALKETETLASHQANLVRKSNPTLLERTPIVKDVLKIVAGRANPEQVALRALNVQPSLNKKTKEIAKLYELANFKERPVGKLPSAISRQAPKSIADASIRAKQLTGPTPSKRLDVTQQAGEGFERINPEEAVRRLDKQTRPMREAISNQPKALPAPENFERVSREEAVNRIKDFAFKYFKPEEKSKIISIGDAFLKSGDTRKISPKKMGIDPYTGEYKAGKPKTALQAALERIARKNWPARKK